MEQNKLHKIKNQMITSWSLWNNQKQKRYYNSLIIKW